MAKGFVTGPRLSFDDSTDEILQIEEGIKYLNTADNGIRFMRKLINNRGGKVAKSHTYYWDETALPARRETITLADAVGTTVTVANSKAYRVGDLLKCESEVMRVTALASATTLTVTRAYAGTTGAAHAAKVMFNLGYAAVENSTGPQAVSTTVDRLYNYVQQFEDAVELSDIEIATLSSESGNPLNAQLERLTLSFWKRFAQAVLKGVRYNDTTNKFKVMGGIDQFLSTNVATGAGALAISTIDNQLLNIINAGGNPDTIVLNPYQKQKLDALDVNKQLLGKKEHTGGNLVTQTWQSGIMDHSLDVVVDHTLPNDELYIFDSSTISVIPLSNNGVDGRLSVVDASLPGQSGTKKLLRAYYTTEVVTEAANAKISGLS